MYIVYMVKKMYIVKKLVYFYEEIFYCYPFFQRIEFASFEDIFKFFNSFENDRSKSLTLRVSTFDHAKDVFTYSFSEYM